MNSVAPVVTVTSSTIILNWSAPLLSLQNGIIQNYVVNLTNSTGFALLTTISPSALYFVFRNLTVNQLFWVAVAAVTVGTGVFTQPIAVATNTTLLTDLGSIILELPRRKFVCVNFFCVCDVCLLLIVCFVCCCCEV